MWIMAKKEEYMGKYKWKIQVPESLWIKGEMYLHADAVEIMNGDLMLVRGSDGFIFYAFSKGNWLDVSLVEEECTI